MRERMRQAINVPANAGVGDRDGKDERTHSCHRRFAVLAGVVGRMDCRVREERANREKHRRSPAVHQVARKRRERHKYGGSHGQQTCFACNREMGTGD